MQQCYQQCHWIVRQQCYQQVVVVVVAYGWRKVAAVYPHEGRIEENIKILLQNCFTTIDISTQVCLYSMFPTLSN